VRKDRLRPCDEQEIDGARVIGGERVRGSGRGKQKGDFKNALLLSEAKTTGGQSLVVKMEVLCKIIREAEAAGRVPVFEFGFDNMPDRFPSDWFCLPADRFEVVCKLLSAVAVEDFEEAKEWLSQLCWMSPPSTP
jgi:hypothetical protein